MLYFRILSQDMNCVAAIGVVHFSVRGFGCALFYFRKEYENMRAKKFSAVATAVALLISLTACTGTGNEQASSADKSTSDIIDSATSSVDEHTSTESVEETSSGNDNANDESTITESAKTSVADTTSSIPMKEEKIEERDVYDEDGNVVDKIKVKVVDGVTYTVGEKSDDKCILDGVPLFTNDPEFPSGDIITMTQIAICRRGFNISQQEIFEKYVKYHTPDEWYEEDGVSYGPMLGGEYLNYDPRLEPQKFFNGFFVNLDDYCEKFFEDKNVEFYDNFPSIHGETELERIKKAIFEGYLVAVKISDPAYGYEELEWFVMEDGGSFTTQGLHTNYRNVISIGFADAHCIVYNTNDGEISILSKEIFDAYTI